MPQYKVLGWLADGRLYSPGEGYSCSPEQAAVLRGMVPPVLGEEVAQAATPPASLVDVNTADLETLITLPHIGAASAAKIVAGRPYYAVEDIQGLLALPQAKWAKLEPRLTLEISPDGADHDSALDGEEE